MSTTVFDFNNLPNAYQQLWDRLPWVVQQALRAAHANGMTMNDVYITAENALNSLRSMTGEDVANAIGAMAGAGIYAASPELGPATRQGITAAAGVGSSIANAAYNFDWRAVTGQNEQTPPITSGQQPTISPETNRRIGPSLPNLQATMDNNNDTAPQSLVTAAGAQAGSQRGNRETKVRYDARAEMGIFTETRTAYLPITFYLSVNRPVMDLPIPLYIRMDWPHNILSRNTLVRQFLPYDQNKFHARTQGLSNDMALSHYRRPESSTAWQVPAIFHEGSGMNKQIWNIGQLNPFPTTIKGQVNGQNPTADTTGGMGFSSSGTILDGTCIPAYRKWYAKQYQYAHVMETDYKVTYTPCESNTWSNIHVFEGMDVQSTNNTDVIPTDREYGAVQHWPGLKQHAMYGKSPEVQSKPYVISGTWRDNDFQRNRMVANEEDIKTWEKLGSVDFSTRSNNYREDLVLLNYMNPESTQSCFNVRVDLRYKIQFKDLAKTLRWLNNGGGAVSLTSDDCVQIPKPTHGVSGPLQNPERVFSNGVLPY